MKTALAGSYVRLGAVLAAAAPLAASVGSMHWSDETLKQEIVTFPNATQRLLSL